MDSFLRKATEVLQNEAFLSGKLSSYADNACSHRLHGNECELTVWTAGESHYSTILGMICCSRRKEGVCGRNRGWYVV